MFIRKVLFYLCGMELRKAELKRGRPKKYFYEDLFLNDLFEVKFKVRGGVKTSANKWGATQEPVREFDIYTDGEKYYLKRIL